MYSWMRVWMRIWIRCIIWFFQDIGMDLGNKSIIFSRMWSGIFSNLMNLVMSSKILDRISRLLSSLRKQNNLFSHLGCSCKEQIILKRVMHSQKSEYDIVCWGPLTVGVWVGVGLGSGLVWASWLRRRLKSGLNARGLEGCYVYD